ncbi:Dyp-type peroxidase [Streptomyces echinatus]|uniref:Dyp-type peroxidase n=1 Tax=Streptomyces echinatus TaxID=67293 RepID=UPI003805CD0F
MLRTRPSPYVGTYILLRVDDPRAGRELMGRLAGLVDSAANWWQPPLPALLNVAVTYRGLEALQVPHTSLNSFPEEFRQGMAARAEFMGDTGESAPVHWEPPFGTGQVHIVLSLVAADQESLAVVLERARQARAQLPGVQVVYRQELYQLASGRTSFGYKDGISNPAVEGSGAEYPPGGGPALKAGEFVLGHPDETGSLPLMPEPDVLGRNGTFVVWRKLHTRVAAFRRYLRDNARGPEEESLLAAKIVGRWPSGAPLILAPERDDPDLGADDQRNNDFLYASDPRRGEGPAHRRQRRLGRLHDPAAPRQAPPARRRALRHHARRRILLPPEPQRTPLARRSGCLTPSPWGSPVSRPVLGCTWVTGSTSRIAWPWFHRCPGPPRHRVRSGAPVRQEGLWAHMARAPSGGHAGERQSPRPDGRERAGHTGPEDRR